MTRRWLVELSILALALLLLAPATPAAAANDLVLTQSSESSELGQTVTFSARIYGFIQLDGDTVTLVVDGKAGESKRAVRQSELDIYGADFSYTRRSGAGTYAVSFTWTSKAKGSVASPRIQHTWTEPSEPAPPPKIQLTGNSTRSTVGETARFTATLTGESVSDVRVSFAVFRNGQAVGGDSDTTGRGGLAFFSYRSDTAGTDRVVATLDQLGRSDEVRHTWEPREPARLSLQPASQQVPPGGFCVVRATLTRGGEPLDDRSLEYVVTNDASDRRLSGSAATDGSGGATIRWPSPAAGVDTVAVEPSEGAAATATCSLEEATQPDTLTLSPAQSDSQTGTTFPLLATLERDESPVEGEQLTLVADHSKPGVDPLTLTGTTDRDGKALLSWTRTAAGVDTVVVTAAGGARASATHTWRATAEKGRLTVVATPDRAVVRTGTSTTVTVVVRLGGSRESGVRVTATPTMPGQPTLSPTGVTDDRGQVRLTYRRDTAGQDRVTVRATSDGKTATDTVTRTWTEDAAPARRIPTITLSPDGTRSQTGTPFRVTAVVRADGVLLPGATVEFRAVRRGDTPSPREASTRTDSSGEAVFDHTRTRAGREQITATTRVDGRRASAEVTHRWTEGRDTTGGKPTIEVVGPRGVRPGRDLTVKGGGCSPGVQVTLELTAAGAPPILLGRTFADAAGAYAWSAPLPKVPLNRYGVASSCGAEDEAVIDVVGSEEGGTNGAPAAGTATVVLLFFVLLGNAVTKLRPWLG